MKVEQRTIDRFWSKIEIQPDGCWHWVAGKTDDGYGAFGWKDAFGQNWKRSHQFAYWAAYGYPAKPELHHTCHTRICVNPDHLQPMTRKEHMNATPGTYGYKWAQRTHCEKGHLLKGENLVPSALAKGYRLCRTCANERNRQWRKSNPEKMRAAVQRWTDHNRDYKQKKDRERYWERQGLKDL